MINNNLSAYPDFRSLGVLLELFQNNGYDRDPKYQWIYNGLVEQQRRLANWYLSPVSPNGYHEAQVKISIMNDIYGYVQAAPAVICNAWLQMIRSHSSVVRGGY